MIDAIFCWSGGKDSSLALYKIQQEKKYKVVSLLTTINEEFKRVSMHGVREELLEAQAKELEFPLEKLLIPKDATNEDYEQRMKEVLLKYKNQGVNDVIFGDIFLEDLKVYRENNLAKLGMNAVFPLWKQDTNELINEFIELGFGSVLCCTNNDYFNEAFVGKAIDEDFIKSIPDNVDVCGENGEYHSFAFKGPIFKNPIPFILGEKILKTYETKCMNGEDELVEVKGYWFIDILLNSQLS